MSDHELGGEFVFINFDDFIGRHPGLDVLVFLCSYFIFIRLPPTGGE